jgi:site-specific DNA-cytosine methylase
MLDLFCGYKGASAAMSQRGWEVVTVDNVRSMNPTHVADLRQWSYAGPSPDLLWASPPCQEFSRWSMPWTRKRTPRRPDLSLVIAALRIVEECKPRWWILENVRGATRWLGEPARRFGPYYLWGVFPAFKAVVSKRKEHLSGWQKQHRAMVPYPLSLALAIACEQEAVLCKPPRNASP